MKKEKEKIDPVVAGKWLKAIIAILSAILNSITSCAKKSFAFANDTSSHGGAPNT